MDHGSERGWYRISTFLALLMAGTQLLYAQEEHAGDSGTVLYPGAIEIGIGGSLVVVSGITNASIALRGGSFVSVPAGLVGYELGLAYAHISFLDRIDVESRFCWSFALQGSSTLPYVGMGGGVRQELMGTFSQTRYPIGGGVGIRALFGSDVVFRSEYVFRYVAGDPVANYSEHKLEFGLSLLLNNAGHSGTGDE